ncbi:hypothetical protein [Schumannella luteola]
MGQTVHDWPIILLAVASLGAMAASLAVLYSRLLPAGSWLHSFGVSAACAFLGATTWFLVIALLIPDAVTKLFVPIGMMGAVAATLASIALRATDPPTSVVLVFSAAWSLLVFVPVSLATFVTGVVGITPVDHAGSLVVNVAAGAAALGILLVRRRRAEVAPMVVRRWVPAFAVLLLVVAWLAWLAAAELAFDEAAATAVGNGVLGGAGGVVGWLAVQRIRHQSTSVAAVAAGLISGLVAVSAGAPLLSPVAAVSTGVLAGGFACLVTLRRIIASGRDQSFLAGSHLMAGATGLVLVGLVANDAGFLFTGQIGFIQDQLVSTVVVTLYSAGVSFLLWSVLSRIRQRSGDR